MERTNLRVRENFQKNMKWIARPLILALLMTTDVVWGAPPEGLENFGLLGRGKASTMYSLKGTYSDPTWRGQTTAVEFYGGTPLGGNYLSSGARSNIHPYWGDRSAYFLKYDLIV
jgi:hypothetical protein